MLINSFGGPQVSVKYFLAVLEEKNIQHEHDGGLVLSKDSISKSKDFLSKSKDFLSYPFRAEISALRFVRFVRA